MAKLNIGSGAKYLQGWMNVDIHEAQNHTGKKVIPPDMYADAHDLPFEDEKFDKVLMRHVLEHLEHPLTALGEAYRVLKEGGVIGVEVPNPKKVPGDERETHLYSWTKSTLHHIMERAGFEVLKYSTIRNNHRIEGVK